MLGDDGAEPVVIRAAVRGDEEAIRAVCATGFAASSRGILDDAEIDRRIEAYYAPARIRRELAPSAPEWLGYVVAELGGAVVGAGGGGVVGDGVGQVLVLYLDPGRRGRGIGTALLEYLSRQQRELGAVRQRVSVTVGNRMGAPFYRARGFRQVDRVPFVSDADGRVTAWSSVLERPLA
jgi:GNAT superfamily N-acetyltransferase